MSIAHTQDNETEKTACCFQSIFKSICKRSENDENESLITGNNVSNYGIRESNDRRTQTQSYGDNDGVGNHNAEHQPCEFTVESKVEKIKMKPLGLPEVDKIFGMFEETFNRFYVCQTDMEIAMENFKTASKTTGEFRVCLCEFKQELNGQKVHLKKLVLKFPKVVTKGGGSVGEAATALVSLMKTYEDIEKLSVQVIRKSIMCVKDVMQLDVGKLAGEEFGGNVIDVGKISKQLTTIRSNMKEVRKAPKIVLSFFNYATDIVTDVTEVFGDEKNKTELKKRKEKFDSDQKKMDDELEKLEAPKPPEEIKFTSLGIPTIDRIFTDVAMLVNPVISLSKDLFNSRIRLEKAFKAVSEFHDDPSKSFDNYLEELKERLKEGKIHILISVNGRQIEIRKVDGMEPRAMEDMESGFKGILKSGNALLELGPNSIQELQKLLQDTSNISTLDIMKHVTPKELPSMFSALSGNTKQAKKIPDDLKYLFSFARNLVIDVVEVLETKQESDDPNEGNQTDEGDRVTGY